MKDQDKTKEELISELVGMRQRIAEMEGALVTLKQQEATRSCGVVTDNTERQRFLSLLDAMPAYLCLMTPDYHVVFINRYFRERFGDPAGRRCYEFAFGLAEPCENCQSLIVLETKTPNEYEWLGPDGRTYLVCDQLVHDIDGAPLILEMGIDNTERKRSEEALRKSEQRYRLLAENTQDVIWQTDLDLRFTYVNPAIAKVTGYTVDEWIGTRLTEHCDEENFMKMAQAVSEEISKGADSSGTILESVILKKNKEPMSIEIHGKVILGENDLPIALQGVARDISDRKRAEEALRRLNRELRAISACNQTLLRAVDEQTLLNEVCRIICDEPGYRLAWVGYAENDDAKTIRPVAWAGFDSEYMAKANLTWSDDTERGRGPAGTVIRSGETVCVQDFTTDPRMAPWRESALQRGYRSGIALPLKDEGANVFGALLIYHSEPNAMTPNEIHLMEDVAADLAFGIGGLRSRIERQQVEKSLRENEERLSLALLVSNAGRWEWNIQSDEVYFDVRFHEMLGYTMGELPNTIQEWLPYHYPGDMPIWMSKAQAYLRGDSPIYESEHRIRNKAGTWAWVFTRGKLVDISTTGSPKQFIGMAIDVTDRKRAEEALRSSEVQLSNAVMIAHLGPWEYDVTKDLFTFNDHFYKLFRTTAEQVGGYTMSSAEYARRFVHPDDMSVVGNEIRKSIEATDPDFSEKLEHRIVYADGEIGHISVRILLVKDEFGRTVRTYGVNQDITERKRAEKVLQEASSYNRSLIEASLDPLVTISAEGKITDVNAATERVTGYSREELIESDFADYCTDPQKARDGYQRAFTEGVVKDYELEIRHRDGDLTPVIYNASVYHDRSGEIVGVFAAARDITERKVSEELIRVRLNLLEFAASHSLDELLQKTLDDIGALTNSPIGFYHFVESDQKTLSLQAWSTRTVKEFCKAEGKGRHYSIDRAGVWIDSIRERKPVIHNDYSSLPHRKGMPEGHAAVIRELVVPIIKSGQIVAVLGIGNKPTDYAEKDIETVSYLADVAWEIAKRKHAEEGLSQTEERYRSLVENIDLGITLIGPDFNIRMVNTTMGKWFDKPASEFSGKQCFREFEKREAVCSHCPGVRAMSTGQPAEVDTQGVRDDGTRFDVRVRTFPTLGQDGVATGFIEVVEDITERKRMEEALRESEQQYRTLFEESIDGVYSVLRDGEITDANASFCQLFGYTTEEMTGKDIRELYLDPADRPRFQKEIEKKGFVKDYEVKFRKRDGTEVDCLLSSSVHFGKDGSITGYRGIVRDLTTRKALQRQLAQAQKMEAVGTLAGGIAHDFNNLLQVVLGYSELVLADVDLPDHFRGDLGKVLLAGRSGADLVQRLLTFSRKTETKPLDINLNQRIRQTEKFLERTVPKMIDIELVLANDLADIHADPTQMDQVLMNLAVNARDAMPEGGKLIIETTNVVVDEDYAKLHLKAKPGRYVQLSVSDTGSGMDKDTLEHIFEPFYTTKAPGQGTGLGLAMVFGIVQQHHGFINCYSEIGKGTSFKVYLPAVIAHEIEQDVSTTQQMPAFGTETILLVDDEEFIRDLGKRILERSGYTVLTAANGKEALELYRREKEKISLVILDLIMPFMGGKQCLEELLKIDSQVKTLIASGFAANGRTKEAIEKGARGFVDKPYNMKGMLQAVREVLDAE